MKRCSKCGETKPLEAFTRRKDSPDGYRNECKVCRRNYMREYEPQWRAANPDKVKAKFARWVASHPEQELERCRRYDAANREKRRLAIAKSRAENPEHHRALNKAWREANIEVARARCRAYWHRRRSGSSADPTVDAYAEWLLLQNCFYCGVGGPMTIDHVVPISRGGKHEADNLVPACQSCNSSKGTKPLDEWTPPQQHAA